MVWFVTPWVGVVVGLRSFLGSAWASRVFLWDAGFFLLFSGFLWIFSPLCSGGSGVLSHGADSGLGYHG